MEEEIAETGSSLDEKEEESDDQEEEEWSYPCLLPNKSNSLTNTLFDRPLCLKKDKFKFNSPKSTKLTERNSLLVQQHICN
jgi:hypothetical protein